MSTEVEIQILDVFVDALSLSLSLKTPLMLTSEISTCPLHRYANVSRGLRDNLARPEIASVLSTSLHVFLTDDANTHHLSLELEKISVLFKKFH